MEDLSGKEELPKREELPEVEEFSKKEQIPEGNRFPEKRKENGEAFVEFQDVTFGYDERKILKQLSFQVKQGERVTLMGRTGAGKSTILKLLLGLYEPQEGDCLLYTSVDRQTADALPAFENAGREQGAGACTDPSNAGRASAVCLSTGKGDHP